MVNKKELTSLIGAAVLASTGNLNADDLKIDLPGSSGKFGGSNMNLYHKSYGIEEGTIDIDDWAWPRAPEANTQPEMKIVTNPYGFELSGETRPLASQTKFTGFFSLVDRYDLNGVFNVNATTNRIKFQFNYSSDGEEGDTNRLYLFKATRFAQYNSSGQEINLIANLNNFVPFDGSSPEYLDGLPAVVNATNNVPFGTFELSSKFINQPLEIGNKTLSTIDLSKGQVTGVNYAIASQDRPDLGLVQIVNDTNLVVMPNMSATGVNNVGVDLSYIDESGSNYLGNINYSIASTDQAIVQRPRITGIKNWGPSCDISLADVVAGAQVVIERNNDMANKNGWHDVMTNTVPYTAETYGTLTNMTMTGISNYDFTTDAPPAAEKGYFRARE